jgi:hypothetical protein
MSVFDPKQILALAPQISAPDLERTFTRAVKEKNSGLAQLPVSEGVVSPQDSYRTNDRNYHAVDIEACYSCGTQKTEQHSPDYCADNSERNVEHQALSLPVDNLAADESRDEAEHDPTDDGHESSPCHLRFISSACVGIRPFGVSLSTAFGRIWDKCAVISCSDIPVFCARTLMIWGPRAEPSWFGEIGLVLTRSNPGLHHVT